jgi:hypothetical protein
MTTAPSFPGYPPPMPVQSAGPPPPPPGPGVQPPFPAPPIEGKGRRIGWGLGIGAGVLLLICGGGIAAVIGLGTAASRSLNEQAHKAVSAYLDAVHAQRYDQAYAMLCQQAKNDESAAAFRSRVAEAEPITTYQMGDLNTINLTVPVEATYQSGATAQLRAYLGQNQNTAALEVCDFGE